MCPGVGEHCGSENYLLCFRLYRMVRNRFHLFRKFLKLKKKSIYKIPVLRSSLLSCHFKERNSPSLIMIRNSSRSGSSLEPHSNRSGFTSLPNGSSTGRRMDLPQLFHHWRQSSSGGGGPGPAVRHPLAYHIRLFTYSHLPVIRSAITCRIKSQFLQYYG